MQLSALRPAARAFSSSTRHDVQVMLRGLTLVAQETFRIQQDELGSRMAANAGHLRDLAASASKSAGLSQACQHAQATTAEAEPIPQPPIVHVPPHDSDYDGSSHSSSATGDNEVGVGGGSDMQVEVPLEEQIAAEEVAPVVEPPPIVASPAIESAAISAPAAVTPTVVREKSQLPHHHHHHHHHHHGPRSAKELFDDTDAGSAELHGDFRARKVPASSFGRALGFGSLAAGMMLGTAGEALKRTVGLGSSDSSLVLTPANAERLAQTLCRMRGAALKLGQMLSIQDDNIVPRQIREIMERVRQHANVMPKWQLEKVMVGELGGAWREKFSMFDDEPMAAASIGQVHHGVTHDGVHVAVKVQYPGVADSIESDLNNLKLLMDTLDIFPRGLYLDEIISVARTELAEECNYELEAVNQKKFRANVLSKDELSDFFVVPEVMDELSTKRVLTTTMVAGEAIDHMVELPQESRNIIARKLLQLTLAELFDFRFMQTDPNFGNFLYDARRDTLGLIDFGAAREYSREFVDDYLRLVWAAANNDEEGIIKASVALEMITGHESDVMLKAHVAAGMVMGEPFVSMSPYKFESHGLTSRLSRHAPVFAKHRLTPPPTEIYSLHRRLAGAFLTCIHLGAEITDPRQILEAVYLDHDWVSGSP